MAENSKIEWTKHTANLWWGCTKVHEGCDNCYAETLANRWDFQVWGNDAGRRPIKGVWADLVKYQRKAEEAGEIHEVFVGSMMDLFEKPMPLILGQGRTTDYLRDRFFLEVVPNTPNLLYLFLTKRPSNIPKYIPFEWREGAPENVMFGISVVNQSTADSLIPKLLQVKGSRFLSVEPQLGHIDLLSYLHGLDWVINGGESGPGRRRFDVNWARDLRDQCASMSVPYFMKQIDKVIPIPQDIDIKMMPTKTLTS